jgi:TrkA-N domain/RyR domain
MPNSDRVLPAAARRVLSALRWPLTAALALIAVALGWIGFEESATASGHASSATTSFYHALQLFEFHMADVPDPVPWQLDVARFLAPALTLFAAASAVLALVGGQLDRLRARRSSGHVIVCALGDLGTRAARSLRAAGHHVVAIAAQSESSAIAACRANGVIVLIGDATDPETLRLAGVARARYLLALTGDDDANAKIAIDARRLVGSHEGPPLTCFVQIADRNLVVMLERLGVSGSGDERVRVEALNVFDLAARTILDRYPPFDGQGLTARGAPVILVVSSGGLGGRLIAEAARRWQRLPARGGRRLRILLVDRHARRAVESFAERYPGLNAACEIEALDAAPSWAGLAGWDSIVGPDGQRTPTNIYVCLGDDAAGFNAALTMRRRLGDPAVPIVVETTQEGGASAFVAHDAEHPIHQEIDVVAVLDLVSEPAVLLNGQNETIARAIHARYLEGQRLAGVETGATVPWERLSESMRESNRRQAADIGRKLQAIGCVIEPLADSTTPSVEFTPDEIEAMAVLEHERWMADRRADGWRQAATRDDANRMTPYLVPYADLPEAIKDVDRTFVLDIPVRLASIGFAIRRIGRSAAVPMPAAPTHY